MEDALVDRASEAFEADEEARIVEAARSDPQAFGELYDRYHARIYRYIYHRVGHPADAEDITALVFMKALESLHGYRPRQAGFAPWLFRITRNAVVDHYRRRRPQAAFEALEREVGGDDPVTDVLDGERREELRSLVAYLSDEQREVVLMRYSADLSFSEIASILNKNEPAIRMLLHRGLRKLKTVLDDA